MRYNGNTTNRAYSVLVWFGNCILALNQCLDLVHNVYFSSDTHWWASCKSLWHHKSSVAINGMRSWPVTIFALISAFWSRCCQGYQTISSWCRKTFTVHATASWETPASLICFSDAAVQHSWYHYYSSSALMCRTRKQLFVVTVFRICHMTTLHFYCFH